MHKLIKNCQKIRIYQCVRVCDIARMMSVCLYAHICRAPKGQIPTKFDIWDLHEKLSKKSKLV
jgi:hypothetical protein